MVEQNLILLIIVGCFVGAAAGYLGSFMVLKRMSLVGDALSHVALPGIAIALTLNYHPILGALLTLFLAVVGVWLLEENSSIYPEALIGVLFTGSLALGILVTPEPELLEALFGSIEHLTPYEGVVAALASILIIIVTYFISKKLVLGIISKELLKSSSRYAGKINLVYLLLIGTVVALGIKFVGTMLMGALVIVPAASAKNISQSLKSYSLLSILFGVASATGGALVASLFHAPSGPIIVLVSIVFFAFTQIVKRFLALQKLD